MCKKIPKKKLLRRTKYLVLGKNIPKIRQDFGKIRAFTTVHDFLETSTNVKRMKNPERFTKKCPSYLGHTSIHREFERPRGNSRHIIKIEDSNW